jgi:hypothetical protein
MRAPAKCGTTGGYQRHRRAGEEVCAACKQAWASACRAYDARQQPKHGTIAGYRAGCRCTACLARYTDRYERVRAARADAIADEADYAARLAEAS